MICWPSIDDRAPSATARAKEISDKYLAAMQATGSTLDYIVSGGCGDDTEVTTTACEVVMVGSRNHLAPDELQAVLRSLPWEFPEQVEIFWKNEDMETYERIKLHGLPDES